MTIDERGDLFTLSTGKNIEANCNILGIDPNLNIFEGYDGGLDSRRFTAEERREIADYVISLWEKWAALDVPAEAARRHPLPKEEE